MSGLKKAGFFPATEEFAAKSEGEKWLTDFQTPVPVCNYMASLIPYPSDLVLEPTAGTGNLVKAIEAVGNPVFAPDDFFLMKPRRFDCVVMNPPFSSRYAFGVPPELNKYGMRLGYHILTECMKMSNTVIALMPWFTISDSDVRLLALKRWGLLTVTALPRATFRYARIQTVVLQLQKGFDGDTIFRVFDLRHDDLKKPLF
jgi:hypothetical protein